MSRLSGALAVDIDRPDELAADIDRYTNQGGLLALFTYFLLYLETGDDDLAETAALVPALVFITSSLHDDAIDNAAGRDDDLKGFLNRHVTIGDLAFSHVIDLVDELPEPYAVDPITAQFRRIGQGQLDEAAFGTADLSADAAIERVEERGAVWGELAISPVEASGHYSDDQLDRLYTITANLLFILTLIDDVEDIPEDVANDVVNIPLILHGEHPDDHPSTRALVDSLLASDVPDELDAIITTREHAIEAAARAFLDATEYDPDAMVDAWNHALEWFRDEACTVPVADTIPPDRQREMRETLTSGDEDARRALVEDALDGLPVRLDDRDEFVDATDGIPADQLATPVIMLHHIDALVDDAMTTSLEDALEKLRERPTPEP